MIAVKKEIYLDDPEKLKLTFSNLPFKKGQKLEILIFADWIKSGFHKGNYDKIYKNLSPSYHCPTFLGVIQKSFEF